MAEHDRSGFERRIELESLEEIDSWRDFTKLDKELDESLFSVKSKIHLIIHFPMLKSPARCQIRHSVGTLR